ncbi:hypothetical protein [Streptomyces sp. MI02-7b]|uniref:hypothetical protein n=1 Tax=Streptomyces sp. MI02-7b TaxID=462941 RepID=UPI0029A0538F|nr:hypothetical protein [Streptomyces sp. MI02-7b]MDX3074775.1 hypothetical protein [Streptomyces sp. MI02-7b]
MGYTRDLIVARSERPLLDTPLFDAVRDDRDSAVALRPRPGGWQTAEFHAEVLDDPDEVLREVVHWTGAPACVASVSDSDVAWVIGLAPGAERWEVWLNLKTAAALLTHVPDDVDDTSEYCVTAEFEAAVALTRAELEADVPDAARAVLAWARSAGFGEGVTAEAVEEVLRSKETFAEELFAVLLDRLGFPAPVDPERSGRDALPMAGR